MEAPSRTTHRDWNPQAWLVLVLKESEEGEGGRGFHFNISVPVLLLCGTTLQKIAPTVKSLQQYSETPSFEHSHSPLPI